MPSYEFPREIWRIIKSFEYAMTHTLLDQVNAQEYIRYHVSMPYALKLYDQIPFENQYSTLKVLNLDLWHLFSDATIRKWIHSMGRDYSGLLGDTCTYSG